MKPLWNQESENRLFLNIRFLSKYIFSDFDQKLFISFYAWSWCYLFNRWTTSVEIYLLKIPALVTVYLSLRLQLEQIKSKDNTLEITWIYFNVASSEVHKRIKNIIIFQRLLQHGFMLPYASFG